MRFISFLFGVLLVSGCTSLPSTPSSPEQQWQFHRQKLSALNAWQLSGRIAIQTADEGGTASIDWRQQGEHYSIRIIGPIGTLWSDSSNAGLGTRIGQTARRNQECP